MEIYPALPSTLALLCVVLALFSTSLIPSTHAQKFQPTPVKGLGSTFIENQGLYVFGGKNDTQQLPLAQAFMIDLSVSWNASDPAFKKLQDGPRVDVPGATVLPGGEDIFLMDSGTGYIYSTKSDSWLRVKDIPIAYAMSVAADPESELVYFAEQELGPTEWTLYTLNPRTSGFSSTKIPKWNIGDTSKIVGVEGVKKYTWSAPLKSIIFTTLEPNHQYVFTPSKVSQTSNGWSSMITTGAQSTEYEPTRPCLVSAYGGSKMVYFTGLLSGSRYSVVQILDVATRTWTVSTQIPYRDSAACGVSGDHFIAWGGTDLSNKLLADTVVYNMKTNKWISKYTAPPRVPTTTSPVSPTHDPRETTTSDLGDTSTNSKKLAIIITIVVGVLMTIILTAISIYFGIMKRSKAGAQSTNSNGSSSNSLDSMVDIDKGASPGLLRLAGTCPVPENPHAIVEDPTAKRNVQEGEGAIEVQLISQGPHTIVQQEPTTRYNDKEEWE